MTTPPKDITSCKVQTRYMREGEVVVCCAGKEFPCVVVENVYQAVGWGAHVVRNDDELDNYMTPGVRDLGSDMTKKEAMEKARAWLSSPPTLQRSPVEIEKCPEVGKFIEKGNRAIQSCGSLGWELNERRGGKWYVAYHEASLLGDKSGTGLVSKDVALNWLEGQSEASPRELPKVKYEGKTWFFDERLSELRNVSNPHDVQRLNEFEVEYFRGKIIEKQILREEEGEEHRRIRLAQEEMDKMMAGASRETGIPQLRKLSLGVNDEKEKN